MKKMFFSIFSLVIIIFASVSLTKLICDRNHEADTINLQTAKSLLEDKVQLLETTNEAQKRVVVTLQKKNKELALLEKELTKKKDEIEMLNDLIAKLTASPYNPKERIPSGNTDWYYLQKHTAITDTASIQYRLQQACTTGLATGIRIYEDEEGES